VKQVTQPIALTLLHPLQPVPVQSWTFEPDAVIRIGRSSDNDVILYSAVVSRHHVEIRRNDSVWEVISLGANGTYIDGKRIAKVPAIDGMVIRLASSGPKIQIRLGGLPEGKGQKASSTHSEETSRDPSKDTYIDISETDIEDSTASDLAAKKSTKTITG
jgi:pSer/pThr/pTyr-binding forkhead associated (FHA) protein